MIGQRREIFLEARPTRFLADEDIALPVRDLGIGQVHVLIGQVREIPLARRLVERAVLVPGETVKRAGETARRVAVLGPQLAAPVQADVVHRAHGPIVLPHDQERPPGDLVNYVVARLGKVFLARGELPDIGPHLLALERGELFAGVAFGRDRIGAEVRIGFLGQEIGRGARVPLHQLVPADPVAAIFAQHDIRVTLCHSLHLP